MQDLHVRPTPAHERFFRETVDTAMKTGSLEMPGKRIGHRTCIALSKLFVGSQLGAGSSSSGTGSKPLERIILSDNLIRDIGLTAIACNGVLSTATAVLELDGNEISSVGICALASELARLARSQETAGSAAMSAFLLDRLNLSRNPNVGVHAVARVLEACRIRELDITSTGCKGEAELIDALGSTLLDAKTVCQVLAAADCGIRSKDGGRVLARALELNRSLRRLDLSRNFLDDDFLLELARCMSKGGASVLEELVLRQNRITSGPGLLAFCDILSGSSGSSAARKLRKLVARPKMKLLDLSGNSVGDEAAVALSSNVSITTLDLSACGLTEVGAAALSSADGFEHLRLSNNPGLGDAGAIAISHCLEETLLSLVVDGCNIGDEGAVSLCAHLKKTRSISMCQNFITSDGGRAILEVIHLNRFVHYLDVARGNQLDRTTARKISEICARNRRQESDREPARLSREIARLHYQGEKLQVVRERLREERRNRQLEESRLHEMEETRGVLQHDMAKQQAEAASCIEAEHTASKFIHQRIAERETEFVSLSRKYQEEVQAAEAKVQEEMRRRVALEQELDRAEREPVVDLAAQMQSELDSLRAEAKTIQERSKEIQAMFKKARDLREQQQQQQLLLQEQAAPGAKGVSGKRSQGAAGAAAKKPVAPSRPTPGMFPSAKAGGK